MCFRSSTTPAAARSLRSGSSAFGPGRSRERVDAAADEIAVRARREPGRLPSPAPSIASRPAPSVFVGRGTPWAVETGDGARAALGARPRTRAGARRAPTPSSTSRAEQRLQRDGVAAVQSSASRPRGRAACRSRSSSASSRRVARPTTSTATTRCSTCSRARARSTSTARRTPLAPGSCVHLPARLVHCLENTGDRRACACSASSARPARPPRPTTPTARPPSIVAGGLTCRGSSAPPRSSGKGTSPAAPGAISAGSPGPSRPALLARLAGRGSPSGKTSPEELLAAAHGGCFTMSLAGELTGARAPARAGRDDVPDRDGRGRGPGAPDRRLGADGAASPCADVDDATLAEAGRAAPTRAVRSPRCSSGQAPASMSPSSGSSAPTPDAVLVGSGINSLACGALLARAGWHVVVLERNDWLGGCIRTAEITEPGFHHDVLSGWHPLWVGGAAHALLGDELAARGLEYLNTELPTATAFPDGEAAFLLRIDRRERGRVRPPRARRRRGVAPAARRVHAERRPRLRPARHGALVGEGHGARRQGDPPARPARRRTSSAATCSSPAATGSSDTFESERIHGLLAPWVLHTGLGPDTASSGFMAQVIAVAVQEGGMPVPRGGGARLADALVRLIEDNGGVVPDGRRGGVGGRARRRRGRRPHRPTARRSRPRAP